MEKETLASRIAQYIIEDGTSSTTYSGWFTFFDEIEEAFALESLIENTELLEEIQQELSQQVEVLDAEISTEEENFDVVYGTLFCPEYDDSHHDPTGWESILLTEKGNDTLTHSHIYSPFPTLSLMAEATGNSMSHTQDKGELPATAFDRLLRQLGTSPRYQLTATLDHDRETLEITYNPSFYKSQGQDCPENLILTRQECHQLFEKALYQSGRNLSHPPTCYRMEQALTHALESHTHENEEAPAQQAEETLTLEL